MNKGEYNKGKDNKVHTPNFFLSPNENYKEKITRHCFLIYLKCAKTKRKQENKDKG